MQKRSLILIICGIVVTIAIVLLVIYLVQGGPTDIKSITAKPKTEETDAPILTLSAYPTEKTEGNVEISIVAKTDNKNEITSITMPDGKTIGYTEDSKYTVKRNGDYTFTVKSSNGKKTTETISIQNIIQISADNPYIPDGFTHVDGTEVDTGFIIQDKGGNQYVWVPVETGTPVRTPPSDKYVEDNYTASALNNSIAKYYGFYIARYESSRETVNGIVVARSIEGAKAWANVNYDDAFNAARNTAIAYNYVDVKTALMNSYAWDTALNWMNSSVMNYSTSRAYGNYTNQVLATGATESDIVNGIADMAGNLREWTTEKYEEDVENEELPGSFELSYRVVRGGSATMDKIANSRIGERTDLQDNYWGFRMILYKE